METDLYVNVQTTGHVDGGEFRRRVETVVENLNEAGAREKEAQLKVEFGVDTDGMTEFVQFLLQDKPLQERFLAYKAAKRMTGGHDGD